MLFPKKEVVKRYPKNPILTADDVEENWARRTSHQD